MVETLQLRPYQEDGVRFLLDDISGNRYHKLLADDMGLGKTVQVVGAMNEIDCQQALIICPATVKIHWARTIAKFRTRPQRIFVVNGSKAEIPPGTTVVIANYEILLKQPILRQIKAKGEQHGYTMVVLDEAHYLKGIDTQRTKTVLGAKSFLHQSRYKICLTGTPIINRPEEFYPLLYALAPSVIDPHRSWDAFTRYFCNAHRQRICNNCSYPVGKDAEMCTQCGCRRHSEYGMNTKGSSNEAELAERLKSFMLRRTIDQVESQLPDVVETIIELDCRPPAETDFHPIATVRRLLAIEKIPEAGRFITDLLHDIDKLVVFAYHRDVIDGLTEKLQAFNPVKCYGGMTSDQKQESIDAFVNDPLTRLFIGQTMAGGTGVDGLQHVCNHVCHIEIDWAPGIMDQANGRLRRIGQSHTVFAYYLVVPDSLDTDMHAVVENKRDVIRKIVKTSEVQPTMTIENALKKLTDSIDALAAKIETIGGAGAGSTATSTPAASASSEKPAAETHKAASDPQPAAEKPVGDSAMFETLRKELAAFLTNRTADLDEAALRKIVQDHIWPKYGIKELTELKPDQYAGVIEDLQKGPSAYTSQADPLSGI